MDGKTVRNTKSVTSKTKQTWYTGASSWFYYRNNIRMHGPMNVKYVVSSFIHNSTNTHSEYVVLNASPLQQCLNERSWMLRYTYIGCLLFIMRIMSSITLCYHYILNHENSSRSLKMWILNILQAQCPYFPSHMTKGLYLRFSVVRVPSGAMKRTAGPWGRYFGKNNFWGSCRGSKG